MKQDQQERVYQLLLKRLEATPSEDFEEVRNEKGVQIGYATFIATKEGRFTAEIIYEGMASSPGNPSRELRVTTYEVEAVGVKKEKRVLRREERRESALDKLYMRVMQGKACEEQQRDQDRLNALEAALSEEE